MSYILTIFILIFVSFSPLLVSEQKSTENIKVISLWDNTEKIITFKQLTHEIKNKTIIYIGENHDNANHHNIQLDIIKSLYNQNKRIAIGMEMFQSQFQKTINDYIFGNISEKEFIDKTDYKKRWGIDYDLYKPIIDFARTNRILLVALNIESELIKKISKYGISDLEASDLNKLPKHIDFTNENYKSFLFKIYKDHPDTNDNSFIRFYSIQLVWDEFMAESIDSFLRQNNKYQMVVLAGNGHLVYGYGIPSRAYRRNKKDYSIILNDIELKPLISDYLIQTLND